MYVCVCVGDFLEVVRGLLLLLRYECRYMDICARGKDKVIDSFVAVVFVVVVSEQLWSMGSLEFL